MPRIRQMLDQALSQPVPIQFRPMEQIGPVRLSVQNHWGAYCRLRRRDGMNPGPFRGVEVALFLSDDGYGFCRPSQVGVEGFDQYFDDNDSPIGTYVPLAVVRRLRQALILLSQESH